MQCRPVFFSPTGTYVALREGRYYVFGTDTREPHLIAAVARREHVLQATRDGATLFVRREEGTTSTTIASIYRLAIGNRGRS